MVVLAVLRRVHLAPGVLRADRARGPARGEHRLQQHAVGAGHALAAAVGVVVAPVRGRVYVHAVLRGLRRGRAAAREVRRQLHLADAHRAGVLAHDHRGRDGQRLRAPHAGAGAVLVVVFAGLRRVDDLPGGGRAPRAGGLAGLQRGQERHVRCALHVGAVAHRVEIIAALRRPDLDAACVLREAVDVFLKRLGVGGVGGLAPGAADADRAGGLPRELRGLLGDGRGVLHAGAVRLDVVISAVGRRVIGRGVEAQRAGRLAAVLRELDRHVGCRDAGGDVRAVLDRVVVDAGGRAVDVAGAGGLARADRRAGERRRRRALERIDRPGRVEGRGRRNRGRRRDDRRRRNRVQHHAGLRPGRVVVRAAGQKRDDDPQDRDEPDRGHGAHAGADHRVELAAPPQEVYAQRREQHEQRVGDPVVLVDVLHEGALLLLALYVLAVFVVIALLVVLFPVFALVVVAFLVVALLIVAFAVRIGILAGIAVVVASVFVVGAIVRINCVLLVHALGHVHALAGLQAEGEPLNLAVAPAEGKSRLRDVELQFPDFMRCHILHLVADTQIYIVILL
ncbi:MAG: hypothetical protein BWY81_00371 [Firmicutes bacterium ADurb.Bin467]|nr:MAG: hypothetical protein BWY81_00371 [Firmicutes bacterium ADurb.Bin467]